MRQFLIIACITLLMASPASAVETPTPTAPDALQLWLIVRQHFQNGTPYKKPMKALAALLPESVTALPQWQNLAAHSAHPPASRTELARNLRALLTEEVKPETLPEDASTLTRMRAQLARHLHIRSEESYAEAKLRETLRTHAARGELMAAARLIEEQSSDEALRAWHTRYKLRISDMHDFSVVAKAIMQPPAPTDTAEDE